MPKCFRKKEETGKEKRERERESRKTEDKGIFITCLNLKRPFVVYGIAKHPIKLLQKRTLLYFMHLEEVFNYNLHFDLSLSFLSD